MTPKAIQEEVRIRGLTDYELVGELVATAMDCGYGSCGGGVDDGSYPWKLLRLLENETTRRMRDKG